jgi:hypothetical protein
MTSRESRKRTFEGMSYREIQRFNSKKRVELHKEDQQWLKNNGYKNLGWNNVIQLHQKIKELLDKYEFADLELEELFLEADRIGNKYQTDQEREEFNQKLSKEASEIAEEIDKQFPDTEVEVIDFSEKNIKPQKQRHQKTYRTTRI